MRLEHSNPAAMAAPAVDALPAPSTLAPGFPTSPVPRHRESSSSARESFGLRAVLVGGGLAVGAFHVGFLVSWCFWLVAVWLGALFALRHARTPRLAFYGGLAIGLLIYGPQLHFFWRLFGPAAVMLWLILAFWIGLFLLGLRAVQWRWGPGAALWLAPVGWMAIEYFRSELYPLRFSWFLAGSFLPLPAWGSWLHFAGVYGAGAVAMLLAGLLVRTIETRGRCWTRGREGGLAMGLLLLLALAFWWQGGTSANQAAASAPLAAGPSPVNPASAPVNRSGSAGLPAASGMNVAGVQLEFPGLAEILASLNAAIVQHPEAELIMLSEYAIEEEPPPRLRRWCRDHARWLAVGGRDPRADGGFYNTAFVISPAGEVVFKQAKNVPIQFFNDGVPSAGPAIWASPWGPIGIAICYDASYTRVMDRYVRLGARALLLPAMDVVAWGEHEHRLNARQTLVRAAEYGLPVFRVASSGISQIIAPSDGLLLASAPFPGPGATLAGRLAWSEDQPPSLPWDRWVAPAAVGIAGVVLAWGVGIGAIRARRGRERQGAAGTGRLSSEPA